MLIRFGLLLALVAPFIQGQSKCFEEIGCFPTTDPWRSILRPFPPPQSPTQIGLSLYLSTRSNPGHELVTLWPNISLGGIDFDPTRSKTVFIMHGFRSDRNVRWIQDMKDAYLEQVDANVFTVDWGNGASSNSYSQAASNIRVVGAELVRFGKYLLDRGVRMADFHLIGHSLGAHISSYMAKGLNNNSKIGRITGLDPAQPGFEGTPVEVRLAKTDAIFVDVLHTDARPLIPTLGFGLIQPVGDVDIYVNGGSGQPGCSKLQNTSMKSALSLMNLPMSVLYDLLSCSHHRACEIFIATLKRPNCKFWGRPINKAELIFMISSLGFLELPASLTGRQVVCDEENCTEIGLKTPLLKPRGSFITYTSGKYPFCLSNEEQEKQFLLGRKIGTLPKNAFSNIFG